MITTLPAEMPSEIVKLKQKYFIETGVREKSGNYHNLLSNDGIELMLIDGFIDVSAAVMEALSFVPIPVTVQRAANNAVLFARLLEDREREKAGGEIRHLTRVRHGEHLFSDDDGNFFSEVDGEDYIEYIREFCVIFDELRTQVDEWATSVKLREILDKTKR
jgi:hypothetical protein